MFERRAHKTDQHCQVERNLHILLGTWTALIVRQGSLSGYHQKNIKIADKYTALSHFTLSSPIKSYHKYVDQLNYRCEMRENVVLHRIK